MPDPSALATAIHARAAALQAISQRGRRSSWHRARVPRRPLGRHVRPTVGKTSRAKICRSSAHVPIELRGDMTADTETLPCVRGTTTIQIGSTAGREKQAACLRRLALLRACITLTTSPFDQDQAFSYIQFVTVTRSGSGTQNSSYKSIPRKILPLICQALEFPSSCHFRWGRHLRVTRSCVLDSEAIACGNGLSVFNLLRYRRRDQVRLLADR